ncbi:MAG: enterochelin esterase [Gammaproteobacteria bacterium]|mgnify:CR=1 FL=1|nr:enterochelin esterase [Gammaproteobacteria bacterium]MBT4493594.1 enterochelin esterase [Gammaproteobacteria bacterium]
MPLHVFTRPRGRIEEIEIESKAIADNVLGDPTRRSVIVYLPEAYDDEGQDYPLIVDLAGFTGSGYSHVGWKAFHENAPQQIDRLIEEGQMGKVIIAFPDCFTSLGGNQYINSATMGNWEDFLCDEMVPALEAKFRLRKGRDHRGIFGKSSGGYGAIVHGMRRADTWAAVACHSGDMDFDLCYRSDFAGLLRTLSAHDNSIETFIRKIRQGRKVSGGDFHYLMMLAMAASYDPDPSAPYGIRLPVSDDTCELIEDRWQNWLDWDPVRMIDSPEAQRNLMSLNGLFIDCGSKDQYNLVFGARQLTKKLQLLGIDHRYEEFPDNHSTIDYRRDISLPFLYEAIR